MLTSHFVYSAMNEAEKKQLFGNFEIENYLHIDISTYNYLDLHKLIEMINDRMEVLWEYTWIDGYLRPNNDEEINELEKLNNLRNAIIDRIKKFEREMFPSQPDKK